MAHDLAWSVLAWSAVVGTASDMLPIGSMRLQAGLPPPTMGETCQAPMQTGIDLSHLLPESLALALEIERIERIAAGEKLRDIARDHERHWQEYREGIQAPNQGPEGRQ